jgi:hypothetical protein
LIPYLDYTNKHTQIKGLPRIIVISVFPNRKTFAAPSTINRELGILRNMLRLASEWYEIQLKPLKFEMAKEEQKERILSEPEIRRLVPFKPSETGNNMPFQRHQCPGPDF